jgi:predicted ATPase
MRTTITLDDDVHAAVEQLRAARRIGPSEALNELARRGLAVSPGPAAAFVQSTADLGTARLPLDDIGGLLEALEGPDHR